MSFVKLETTVVPPRRLQVAKLRNTGGGFVQETRAKPRQRRLAGSSLLVAGMLALLGCAWPVPAGATTVRVPAGETLSQIAVSYGTSTAELAAANGIADPNNVEAGTVLQIPTAHNSASSGTRETGSTTVKVQPGESLWSIASRFGTTTTALAVANGITNSAYVLSGAVLIVPLSPAATSASTSNEAESEFFPVTLLGQPVGGALTPLFQHWASTFGVSLSLLEGMCWWESGWQMGVVSPTGAVGVGQLEPATVTSLRDALGDQSLDPENTSDNIEMAAYYLHQLLVQNGGDVNLALASYYQGPTSVSQVGMMTSTAQYVKGVLATTRMFS